MDRLFLAQQGDRTPIGAGFDRVSPANGSAQAIEARRIGYERGDYTHSSLLGSSET